VEERGGGGGRSCEELVSHSISSSDGKSVRSTVQFLGQCMGTPRFVHVSSDKLSSVIYM